MRVGPEFVNMLRRKRLDARRTQEDVAREVGISRSLLSRWETGDRPLRPEVARRIATALLTEEKK